MELLQKLLLINSLSGNEGKMRDFLVDFFHQKGQFRAEPRLHYGHGFQDCLVVAFGKPRTAIFAHMDTIGFMVRYEKEVVAVGAPEAKTGYKLNALLPDGPLECSLVSEETAGDSEIMYYDSEVILPRGTELVFAPDFQEDENYIQSPYMDNRLGLFNALEVSRTLENGLLVFTCGEEHAGGTAGYLAHFIYKEYGVLQALVSDITWITHGIHHGWGVVVSLRDSCIPRRAFVNRILALAVESGIPFQLEVEDSGGSDGSEIQKTAIPMDWCFIGAAESNVHSPTEKVHKADIAAMVDIYRFLMERL